MRHQTNKTPISCGCLQDMKTTVSHEENWNFMVAQMGQDNAKITKYK